MKCPCRGCTDRTLTCHAVCERFGEWKKYEADRKAWLAQFGPVTSEQSKKGEIKKIRSRQRGWGGRKWKYE